MPREYNINNYMEERQGIPESERTTDLEVIEHFDLDPSLANTPQLNDAVLQAVWQTNYDGSMNESAELGMDLAQSQREATEYADAGMRQGKRNLAEVVKQRGY